MGRHRPAFKVHGGKHSLSKLVIDNLPSGHQCMDYLEPFCGAGSVLLNKPPARLEVLNDIDPGVITILDALRLECREFLRRLGRVRYSEATFKKALRFDGDVRSLEGAVNEYVLRRMSVGGLKKAFSSSAGAWEDALQALPAVAERLKVVHIFNKAAAEVIAAFNSPTTVVYADPPCLHETQGPFDMTQEQHEGLLKTLLAFRGKVVLSGNPSGLYDEVLEGWRTADRKAGKKIERLWMNF